MENVIFTPIHPQAFIDKIVEQVTSKVLEAINHESAPVETSSKNPFDDYILRSEIVGTGKFISDATAWKWEKKGKIQSYGIGGKRYYKRADVEQLFTKVKKA